MERGNKMKIDLTIKEIESVKDCLSAFLKNSYENNESDCIERLLDKFQDLYFECYKSEESKNED